MNRRPPHVGVPSEARKRFLAAVYDRRMHSEDCARWDYESNNCDECDRHDETVRRARERMQRAEA